MMASYPGQLLSKTFACCSMCLKPTLFDSTAFQRCLGQPKWFFSFAVPRQRQRAASSSDAQTRCAKLGLTWLAGRQRSAGRPSRQPLEEALRKDDWAANAAVKCPTGARTVVSRARAGGNCRSCCLRAWSHAPHQGVQLRRATLAEVGCVVHHLDREGVVRNTVSWRSDLLWGVTATHRLRLRLLVLVATCHLILFPETSVVEKVAQTDTSFPHIPRQKKKHNVQQMLLVNVRRGNACCSSMNSGRGRRCRHCRCDHLLGFHLICAAQHHVFHAQEGASRCRLATHVRTAVRLCNRKAFTSVRLLLGACGTFRRQINFPHSVQGKSSVLTGYLPRDAATFYRRVSKCACFASPRISIVVCFVSSSHISMSFSPPPCAPGSIVCAYMNETYLFDSPPAKGLLVAGDLLPFWLKPFLFKSSLLTRVDRFHFSLFFCTSVRRGQRLGRSSARWVQILRGPRPVTQKWTSAKANRQQPEQVLGRRTSVSDRPGRWRREPHFVGQPSQPRPRLSPEESRAGATTKVARLQAALLTLGPEDLVEKAALEVSLQKAQVQATVQPVAEAGEADNTGSSNVARGASQALPSGSSGLRIGILNVRTELGRRSRTNVWCAFEAEEVHPMEDVIVTDWEAEAEALRQQIVELEGQRKSSVLRRVVASHPSSLPSKQFRWYRNVPPNDRALRRRSSIVSPTPLGVVVCEASGVERRLEMGDPLIVAELTQLLAAGGAKTAGDVRCNMMKKWQERESSYGMRACGVGEAAHPGPPSRRRRISSDECASEENPRPARSRSRILYRSEAVEFDSTRGDSDDEPLDPATIGACHHFPHGSTTVARRQRANYQRRL